MVATLIQNTTTGNILEFPKLVKIGFLLVPVVVSLIWAVKLRQNRSEGGAPQRFLSKFMTVAGMLFFCQLLYYAPVPVLFPWFDLPLTFLGLIIFPLYYIYFRILTVDEKFSFRAHARYLVLPVVIVSIYAIGMFFADKEEYSNILYNHPIENMSKNGRFLKMVRLIIMIIFFLKLILAVLGNQMLLKRSGNRAAQYYSDINDAENSYSRSINRTMIIAVIISLVFNSVGRSFLVSNHLVLVAGAMLFSITLYIIGKQGVKAKLVNPGFSFDITNQSTDQWEKKALISGERLHQQLLFEFEHNKIHLKPELSIIDLSKIIGTNRSYVSIIINQNFNQNFCTFVNGFRIRELEKMMTENTGSSTEELAESCGFGSTKSLKRAIRVKTGLSFPQFKKQIADFK
jgi:AraC-like DNA-binding protein